MKKNLRRIAIIVSILIALGTFVYTRLKPFRELKFFPSYKGTTNFSWSYPAYDSSKKTVIIMADNDMTELFDFLTPYYLFNETGKANVYVAASKKYPIVTQNGPFVLPHFTYSEVDSLGIVPDLIVIPYMHAPESPEKKLWIQKHFSDSTLFLSICDGAWTAAASGIYDGKQLTSHATGHEKLRKKFPNPDWVQNTSVTQDGNLYSTGGVSNATDGSLKVIERLFGKQTMLAVLQKVRYPHSDIKLTHISNSLSGKAKFSALTKMLFRKNKNLAVLLQDGVNEMDLAAVIDVGARSLPWSILSIAGNKGTITTKHGLTVISTDKINPGKIDELHVLEQNSISRKEISKFKNSEIIYYDARDSYIVDFILEGIRENYGQDFSNFVKLTLDYN